MVKTNLANDKLECKQQTNSGHDDTPILTQRQHDNNTTNAIPTTPQQHHKPVLDRLNGTVPGPPPNVRIQASKRPSFQALLGSIVSHKNIQLRLLATRQTTTQQTNNNKPNNNNNKPNNNAHPNRQTDRQTDAHTRDTRHTQVQRVMKT